MPAIRTAAVAGRFYPGERAALAAEVAFHLARAVPGCRRARPPKALIAPHAGYQYSGPIAGSIYSRIAALAGSIERVVLLGPAHREFVRGVAIPAAAAFATPLGSVELDGQALGELRKLSFVEVSDSAHALEHSLEVQLPFLQVILGRFRLVPVVVGAASTDEVRRLLETVWGGSETLIVVSSDLSHYLPYEAGRRRDRSTSEAIVALQPQLDGEQACGAAPINGLLAIARQRGLVAELVDLRSSGDTEGDRDRVVGYGGFAFFGGPGDDG